MDTLSSLHVAFADYLQEDAPPATTDPQYSRRTRWFNQGRKDLAGRWFFESLLKAAPLTIAAGDNTYTLPADFTRGNALRVFSLDTTGTIYTNPYNRSTMVGITRDHTTGLFQLYLVPTPSTNENATINYYATPTDLSLTTDLTLVDGPAVLFYALTQHYLAEGDFNKMQEFRAEYENRVRDIIRIEQIDAPGDMTSMQGFENARGSTEKHNYITRRRRSLA